MALPKAVQQQIEDADRLVAEINGDKTGDDVNQNPETGEENEPQEPAAQVVEPAQPVSQEPVNQIPEEKWENKYHTLKGMYDAEVPRLHSQVKELNSQVQQLIADAAAAKAQVPQETKAPSLITEQDKEAFGPDLIDLIERATESKVSTFRQREEQLISEIRELKGKLGDVSERQVVSDKDRFLMGLGQRVPDWESLNVDQGFLAWLSEVDPVYGIPKQVALTNAYEALDVNRVATVFEAYKKLVTPAQPTKQKNQELQRQVAPTRSRASSPDPADSNNQRIFSHQEIGQFYEDVRRGNVSPEDAARIENEIHAAAAEGRIRQDQIPKLLWQVCNSLILQKGNNMATVTPGAVYPINAGGFNAPNGATAYSGTAYSGTFIPTLWSGKLAQKFYAATVFGEIANTDWQGDITGMGDTVIINTIPTISVNDYSIGQNLAYEIPAPSTISLTINKGKYFGVNVNNVLELQAKPKLMDVFTNDAAMQMKIAIDRDVLGGTFNQGAAYNQGATAGKISGGYNLGTDAAAVTLTAANILQNITALSSVLDEANVPETDRWLVITPTERQILMQSNLAQAQFMGDGTSVLRNGKIGMIDRFTVYVSNLTPRAAAATNWDGSSTGASTYVKRHAIMAGHKSGISFASQIAKVESLQNPNDFGTLIRGLNVYGYKVTQADAVALLVAAG